MDHNGNTEEGFFAGYEKELSEIKEGIINGNSYALIDNTSVITTHVLLKLREELEKNKTDLKKIIPKMFSMDEFPEKISSNHIFNKLYELAVEGLSVNIWQDCSTGENYENFVLHIKKTLPFFEKKYGNKWQVVFLIDKFHKTSEKLDDNDFFFNNLYSLLANSSLKRRFCVVAGGDKTIYRLTGPDSTLKNFVYKDL